MLLIGGSRQLFFYLWFNIFWTDIFEVPTIRLTKNEGALFSPSFCLPFFLSLRAFFCANFPPFFFFQLFLFSKAIFWLKSVFVKNFYRFLLAPSFRPPFFLGAPSFFFFSFEGYFFRTLFYLLLLSGSPDIADFF